MWKISLKRGEMEDFKNSSPEYVGEFALCTDQPFIGVGTVNGWEMVPLPTELERQLQHQYPSLKWTEDKYES